MTRTMPSGRPLPARCASCMRTLTTSASKQARQLIISMRSLGTQVSWLLNQSKAMQSPSRPSACGTVRAQGLRGRSKAVKAKPRHQGLLIVDIMLNCTLSYGIGGEGGSCYADSSYRQLQNHRAEKRFLICIAMNLLTGGRGKEDEDAVMFYFVGGYARHCESSKW